MLQTNLYVSGFDLFYYQNNISKIDFLLYTKNEIILVEVKASDNVRSKSLRFILKNINQNIWLENNKTMIKSAPLYVVFCIENDF